jgi:hypothetical protein
MEKKSILRDYMLNAPEEGLLMNEGKKNEFINFMNNQRGQLETYFRDFITELLTGSDDQMIEHFTNLFYQIFIEPEAIHKLHSKMNMDNLNMDKTGIDSMPGCRVTGCLDGLIGGSIFSKNKVADGSEMVNNSGSEMVNNSGSSGVRSFETMRGGYQPFEGISGWQNMRSITLPGTEASGCKNDMTIADSSSLCNSSPECDGFYAYARNDSDRVCFKTNVDTTRRPREAPTNIPTAKFFVKRDRVRVNQQNSGASSFEAFGNIEEVDGNKDIPIDNNNFGNIMTTLLFVILVYYLCKKLKLF